MRANLYAFTSPEAVYPQFISINKNESGNIEIIVRSSMREDSMMCGNTAMIVLSQEKFKELVETLKANLV